MSRFRQNKIPFSDKAREAFDKIDFRKWKTLSGGASCPDCGCEPEVRTDANEPGAVYDGDEIRCGNCKMKGYAEASGEGDAWVTWLDEDGEVI